MESENLAREDAARMLELRDEVSARVALQTQPRRYSWLLVAGALFLGATLGVSLFALSMSEFEGRPNHLFGQVLLLPAVIGSVLLSGARERFRVLRTTSAIHFTCHGVALALFLVLGLLVFQGTRYPGWLNILASVLAFAAMAYDPIRQLWVHRQVDSDQGLDMEPLSAPARGITVGIGVVLGAHTAAMSSSWLPLISMAILMAMFVMLMTRHEKWSVPRVGYEWHLAQWILFGIAAAVPFLLVLMSLFATPIIPVISVAAGGSILVLMLIAAFLPPRRLGR